MEKAIKDVYPNVDIDKLADEMAKFIIENQDKTLGEQIELLREKYAGEEREVALFTLGLVLGLVDTNFPLVFTLMSMRGDVGEYAEN